MTALYGRQEKLKINNKQSITICGAGGIGFWVCKFAALAGIPKIRIYDPDTFEEHNLNRIDVDYDSIGKNKAVVARDMVENIRPDCDIMALPFKFKEHMFDGTDWIVDCTDLFESQQVISGIAKNVSTRYMKAGYNGWNISINNEIAEWGEAPDQYTVIPSFVVPAAIISALVVAKITNFTDHEIGCKVEDLYNFGK